MTASADPCPGSNAVDNFYTSELHLVDGWHTESGDTSTYFFASANDESPSGGIPGLIEFCVYAAEPDSVDADAVVGTHAFDATIKRYPDPGVFQFTRDDGNAGNVPFDGATWQIGTATWGDTAPSTQLILFHINDQDQCEQLYGTDDNDIDNDGNIQTCFVFPSSDDDHHRTPPFHCFNVEGTKYGDTNGNGVLDDGELGLADWTIDLILDSETVNSTTTASDGSYSMRVCIKGDYTVVEELQDGWVSIGSDGYDFSAVSGQDVTGLDFLNFALFSISGTKFEDANGDGSSGGDSRLGGWTVNLYMSDDLVNAIDTATTASDGTWSFSDLGPGSYVVAEETQDGWVATATTSHAFDGASGTDVTDLDFLNFALFSISGTKFEDANGDGSSGGDSGLGGWTVNLYMSDDLLNAIDTTTTASDGTWSFSDLGPGSYVVAEETQDGWVATGDTSHGFDGSSGTDVSGLDFTNFALFSVSGTKFEDSNGDGSSDGDSGLGGWTVLLYNVIEELNERDLIGSTTTASDGTWSFSDLGPGSYEVEEQTQSGWVATSATTHDFVGASGTDVSGLDFTNFALFSISGTKFEDMNGDGSSTGDSGVEGWVVTLCQVDSAFGLYCTSTATDADGNYAFADLGPGTYTVTEESQDGWVATSTTTLGADGESGTDVSGLDFTNFQLGSIAGVKWYDGNKNGEHDSPEAFIEGLTIQLCDASNNCQTTTTDSNGYYEFTDLGPGTYTVTELVPTVDDSFMEWTQTFPGGDGTWSITVTSGLNVDDANFGNVCEYTAGLTWGYWKTHTGEQKNGPAKDAAYNLLATYPLRLDIKTSDGDYDLENAKEAYAILKNAPADCSGTCRSLFRAQLIALYMNMLKFDGFEDQTFVTSGNDFDGWTVQDIFDYMHDKLLDGGASYSFTALQETLDLINNNGHAADGEHVLVCTSIDS